MKTILKTVILSVCLGILFVIDVPPEFPLRVEMAPEANAVLGVRRRAFRRGAVIGASAAATTEASAAVAAPAAAPAPAPAPVPAPAAAPAGAPPLGSMVSELPSGCTTTTSNNVQYFNCGGVYYRAAFQGNNLVYVVSQP